MVSNNRIDQLFPDVTEHYSTTPPTVTKHVADPVGADFDRTTHDDDRDIDPDPLAHAPDWVRAHIPRHGLDVTEESRRALSARLSRRKATSASPVPVAASEPITSTGDASEDAPVAPTAGHTTVSAPRVGTVRGWGIGSAFAAAVAVIVGAGVVALNSDSNDAIAIEPFAPPGTTTTTTAPVTSAPAAPWCDSSSVAGTVVGRGPGDRSTGPGLIQAFDYAYYVERDSAKVASMMLYPSRIDDIATAIADAANRGVQHCVTIVSTTDPAVFDVALRLRTSTNSHSVVAQHITIATTDTGPKIGTIVEVGS